jgi:DNA-binding transcriptional ArsR family regulator
VATKKDNRAAQVVKALNHPVRRAILGLIRERGEGPLSPREASDQLARPLSNVSYHFRSLANAKVIKLRSTRPARGSVQHFYSVAPDVAELDWVQAILDSTSAPG